MADSRIAYGLAKKHGIDTTGMSPQQVWDALKEKGVSLGADREADKERIAKKFGDKSETSKKTAGHFLDDEYVGRSVGAKVRNLDIVGVDGKKWHILENTHIQNKEVIAGKGASTKFRNAQHYADEYGGKAEDWRKVKGNAIIESDDKSESMKAEIHWVEAESYGKYDGKIKREL